MAGNTSMSWSWLSRAAIPAGLVIAESTWTSLLVSAAINTSPGPHARLPLLTLAVPALLAVAAGRAGARLDLRWRIGVLTVVGVVGAALSAGLISQLSPGAASWWRVAFLPWSATGHRAAVIAGAAWFVAILAWVRGGWLGLRAPGFRQVIWSLGLAVAAFVGVFAGRANTNADAFRAVTGNAGWLLFLWFPFVTAVVALVRQRDLEQSLLRRTGGRPSGAWLMILAVPMLAVALVALVLAVVIGPAAPVVARGVVDATRATGHGIAAVARWFFDLFPKSHPHPAPPAGGAAPSRTAPPLPTTNLNPGGTPTIVSIVLMALIGVGALALIAYLIRSWLRRERTTAPPDETLTEERESLFSWAHLWAQLWGSVQALFRRLTRRLRRPVATASVAAPVTRGGPAEAETVRAAYRRVLRAARTTGQPRRRTETPRELHVRLSSAVDPIADDALDRLTDLYAQVRYGHAVIDDAGAATGHADTVAGALIATLPPAEPRPISPAPHPARFRWRR